MESGKDLGEPKILDFDEKDVIPNLGLRGLSAVDKKAQLVEAFARFVHASSIHMQSSIHAAKHSCSQAFMHHAFTHHPFTHHPSCMAVNLYCK